jgi:hypothetical protein
MRQTAPAAVVPEDPVSIVRLHREACYLCGAVSLPLYPAGSVICARHRRVAHG